MHLERDMFTAGVARVSKTKWKMSGCGGSIEDAAQNQQYLRKERRQKKIMFCGQHDY